MVFSQQFLQTICYFKRVDSYIVGIIVDFLITVVIITSPASLILQKRLRRRDSITSDITSLVIGNHTDVLLVWHLTCMNSFYSHIFCGSFRILVMEEMFDKGCLATSYDMWGFVDEW